MEGPRIVHEGETELHVLHLAIGVFAIPGVERLRTALGVADQERQFTSANDGKAPWLITRIDIGEIGDAVTRHVIMIEGLPKLLRWKDLVLEGTTGGLLDRCPPLLQCLLQRVRRWHPVRQLQLERLVLGLHLERWV